jgi:hypothetical protein
MSQNLLRAASNMAANLVLVADARNHPVPLAAKSIVSLD